MSVPIVLSVGALALGISSHLLLFIHGEWEAAVPRLPFIYAAIEALLVACLARLFGIGSLNTWVYFTIINTRYFMGLFGSIITYRVFFHRLREFPGPAGAKTSVFWSVYKTVPDFQFHKVVQGLHKQYGDFVRIRPREISICHVDAIADIHGPGSVCSKGPLYSVNAPARSLQQTRDKAFHSQRRRVWDKGFTSSALTEYQPRVTEHCLNLIAQLSARQDQPVNITKWLHCFGFDVMGDLTFGKSFKMVDTEGDHFILPLFGQLQYALGVLVCVPWLFTISQNTPILNQKRIDWMNWCTAQVQGRRKMGPSRKDLFTYILGDNGDGQTGGDINDDDLVFDSELAIIGGSDTTSNTLAALIYLLATHPEKLELLQEEIDGLFQPDEEISYQKLIKETPFLQGCLNEALRLYPALPSGLQRLTPPEGAKIAGRWIPGDTIVTTPTYTLHRDPRYFKQPDEFIPERWSSRPELIHDKNAFNPFLAGSYSCVGRSLAFLEMRLLMYLLLKNLSFKLPVGTEGSVKGLFDRPEGVKDFMTFRAPAFDLVFSQRNSTNCT